MSTLAYFMSSDKGKCLNSLNQSVSTTLHWYPSASSLRSICSLLSTLLVPDIWPRPLSGGAHCCVLLPRDLAPSLACSSKWQEGWGRISMLGIRLVQVRESRCSFVYGSVDLWSRRVTNSQALWDILPYSLFRGASRLINLSSTWMRLSPIGDGTC